MNEGDERELLQVAVRAARLAGELLLDRVREGGELGVSSKSTPTDLVSEADLEAERAIRALLAQERPDDGFIGEEGGSESGESGLDWVVDPLDGTVNYLFGIPQWSVSVAVRDQRDVLAGAVFDPNREELFTATRSGPALLSRGDGEPLELRGRLAGPGAPSGGGAGGLSSAMVATGLAYDADVRAAQARVLQRVVPCVRDIRRFGSAALDLAWTAAGRYDAYFERSVKQWDIAAGVLVCQRAGLEVRELAAVGVLPWGVLVTRAGLADALLRLADGE
ncbi:MAG TPA: inositol monophosphatase family protein [Solirubrobacteraceae bacterium]